MATLDAFIVTEEEEAQITRINDGREGVCLEVLTASDGRKVVPAACLLCKDDTYPGCTYGPPYDRPGLCGVWYDYCHLLLGMKRETVEMPD